jgi:hypothetical protein
MLGSVMARVPLIERLIELGVAILFKVSSGMLFGVLSGKDFVVPGELKAFIVGEETSVALGGYHLKSEHA